MISVSADAQKNFFLQPGIGLGLTTARTVDIKGVRNGARRPAIGYSARVGVGYRFGRLEISTGAGLLMTGYKSKDVFNSSDLEGYYHHLTIPALIGLHLGNAGKAKVVPIVGVYAIYTYSSAITYWTGRTEPATVMVVSKGELLHATYRPFTVMGTIQVRTELQITPRFAITCAPGLIGSLGNMRTLAYGRPRRPNQYNFAALVELGAKWDLRRNDKVPGEAEQVP